MDTKPGALGIEGLGDMSFGAHFCLFYETEQDLIETLAFYFNAGLAKDDFCLWITSEPLEKASYAIRQAIPSADRYLEAGNLEIVSFRQWYLEDGVFDAARAIQALERKLSQTLQKGHKGMRILGDESSLSDRDWDAFSNYEAILDEHFANKPMSIVCAYSARTHNLPDILDVARTHRFIAAKRNGNWEILEAPELKHARVEAERFTAEHNELEDKVQERIAHLSHVNQALQAEIIERKQAQEALTESQLRLQVALQAAQIGTGEWDLSANQVTFSESLRRIYGFAPGTLTTTFAEFAERVHPEDRERFRSKLAEALANETDFGLDYRVVWPDGSVRWITGRAHIHRDELSKPTRIVGASMDITERKQAEEALHVSEARLQAAIDATDIVLWERDLLSGHIAWLGHHEKLLGFAPGELDDNTLGGFENRIHPEDIDGLRQMRQRALEERSEYSHEYRVFWRDESIHWLRAQGRFIYNEAGQPVRLYGVVLDTTERKRAEEEVRRQKEIFQKIFDNVPIAITFFDKDGRLLMVNRAWEQMFGWTLNELEERNLNPFVEVLPDPQERQRVYDFIAMGSWAWHESTATTRDGRTINIWAASVQLSDGTGIGLAQDITERKQAESELQKNKEILQKIFDNVPAMITMVDKNGRFILTNRDFEYSLGWRLDQLTEQNPDMLAELYPDPQARQAVLDFAERADGRWEDFKTRAKDGRVINTSWAIVRLSDGSMIGVGKDNTKHKQAEEEIHRYAARMETLAEISNTFVEAGLNYQSVLDAVARRTAELIGDACVMTLFSQDNQRAYPVAFHHPNPESRALMHDALIHTWQGGTNTERFRSLLAGESLYIPVVDQEAYRAATEPEFWPFVDRVGISSALIVPLQVRGRVIGTLGLTRDRYGSPYTTDDQVLLQDIADRAALTIQNAKLFEQVEGARERLEALSRRLLEVQEAERQALTAELHDRVGQNLTGLSINLQNMKASLTPEDAQALAEKFDDAQALVEDTSRQIRDIMAELHLPELDDYGLAAALETYAERAASRGNLELVADLPDLDPPRLPSNVRATIFRAAQEAISNVLKHANATTLEVSLESHNDRVRLKVEDNGQGFEPDLASQQERQTWGLQIMRERIESIGGTVQIDSKPGQGTRVIFDLERPS